MSRCKVCWRAKCRWYPISPGMIARQKTDRLETLLEHNMNYIDMLGRQGSISASAEERLYDELSPIVAELERRKVKGGAR